MVQSCEFRAQQYGVNCCGSQAGRKICKPGMVVAEYIDLLVEFYVKLAYVLLRSGLLLWLFCLSVAWLPFKTANRCIKSVAMFRFPFSGSSATAQRHVFFYL